MRTLATPVLIVGGGPVGLAASICLSRHGVASLLVEQHATTTAHPKATVVNTRTFELFRQWGVEDEVRRGGLPPQRSRFIVWATSLTGYELGRLDLAASADGGRASLRRRARQPDLHQHLPAGRLRADSAPPRRSGAGCVGPLSPRSWSIFADDERRRDRADARRRRRRDPGRRPNT